MINLKQFIEKENSSTKTAKITFENGITTIIIVRPDGSDHPVFYYEGGEVLISLIDKKD